MYTPKYIYENVNSSAVCKNKMLETTQKSINAKWINKLQHIHTMEYHTSNENEQTTTTCNNMDDSHKHNPEQEKPDTKECTLLTPIIKAWKTSQKSGYSWGAGNDLQRGDGYSCFLIWVRIMDVSTLWKFTYTHS